MPGHPWPTRCITHRAGLGFGYQFAQGLDPHRRVADQGLVKGRRECDGHQRINLEAELLVDVRVDGHDGVCADHPGVTVWCCARDLGGADIAASPRLVFNDDRLLQAGLHLFSGQAGRYVTGATRRKRQHQPDGPLRPVAQALGHCGRRGKKRCGQYWHSKRRQKRSTQHGLPPGWSVFQRAVAFKYVMGDL